MYDNGSVLLLNNLNENDAGNYECRAISSFGEVSSMASLKITDENSKDFKFFYFR